MSLSIAEQQIGRFLQQSEPEVMAIKGRWGVGKTYTWNSLLNQARKNKAIGLSKYAYVSLFGIGSIEEFKHAIFQNTIDTTLIGQDVTMDHVRAQPGKYMDKVGRQAIKLMPKLAGAMEVLGPLSEIIGGYAFSQVKKTLICIDDFERLRAEVDAGVILGIISSLKEQKGCKIVMLFNEDKVTKGHYRAYREKVIDVELNFDPTSEQCLAIAYKGKPVEYKALEHYARRLNIKNIRILKKIEHVFDQGAMLLRPFEPEVKDRFSKTLVLLSYCFYGDEDFVPSLDEVIQNATSYLATESLNGILEHDSPGGEDDVRVTHRAFLGGYGLEFMDNFDLEIARAVRSGYFVEEDFVSAAKEKNKEQHAINAGDSFSEAWALFHQNFASNEDDFVRKIFFELGKNSAYFSAGRLNSTVGVLRDLNRDDDASRAIDLFIAGNKQNPSVFDLKANPFLFDEPDTELVRRFTEVHSSLSPKKTLKEVLDKLITRDVYNDEDLQILADTNGKALKKFFEENSGPDLPRYVFRLLEFGSYTNAKEKHKVVLSNVQDALRLLAAESSINRVRVEKKYGLALGSTPHD